MVSILFDGNCPSEVFVAVSALVHFYLELVGFDAAF
jgi:hypothetical protein